MGYRKTAIILIMIHAKKNDLRVNVYCKTQPDETTSSFLGTHREQEAQNNLHELSIFNKPSIVSYHLSSWMKYQTELINPSKKESVWEQELQDNQKSELHHSCGGNKKVENSRVLRRKKHQRDIEFKKTIKEAVKEGKKKSSCVAINFSIPLSKLNCQQRIHSLSMRVNRDQPKKNQTNAEISHTTLTLDEPIASNRKTQSRSSVFQKRSQRKQCSLLVRRRRQNIPRRFGEIPENIVEDQRPFGRFLGELNKLITIERQHVVVPSSYFQCHNRIQGKAKRERLATAK